MTELSARQIPFTDASGTEQTIDALGADVVLVSSGSIALGRMILGLPSGALTLEQSQAAAAVGQIALAHAWTQSLSQDAIIAGQILLTLGDTE